MNQQVLKQCKSVLKKNHLHPLKKIGKGAFATVFLVEKISLQKNLNQLYSVKCINKKQVLKRPSLNKYIKQEIQILRNIEHENVVRSYRTFEDEGWIFMVMEYCNRGNLNTRVSDSATGVLSLEETFYIVSDVLKGLEYMHKRNLLHRDIKAENILLTSASKEKKQPGSLKGKKTSVQSNLSQKFDYITKICDLGFSRVFEEDDEVNTFCGTTCYMAPEIFKKANYDQSVDIWALGVLIFYMIFGEFPFKSLNVEYEIEKKCSNGFSISNVTNIKKNDSVTKEEFKRLESFFRRIFTMDPDKRMSLEDIKQSPWVSAITDRKKSQGSKSSTGPTLLHSVSQSSKVGSHDFTKAKMSDREKTTIDSSDSSDSEAKISSQTRNFELDKYRFISELIQEVERQKFLKSYEEIAFQYYILKMMSCEMNESNFMNSASLREEADKLKGTVEKSLDNCTKLMNISLHKIVIPKFNPEKHFNPKAKEFNEFKEPYRLVVGHVFAKAHKNITQDVHIRSQLKLKLFICHVINRVFNPEHNEGIFVHFENFRLKEFKSKGVILSQKQSLAGQKNFLRNFSFQDLRRWIEREEPEKLVDTIDLINNRFYKGA